VTEISVVPVSALSTIPADQWNALVQPDGGFYTSHEWLHALELAHGANPVLVAVRAGRIMGMMPTWWGDPADSELFSLPAMAAGLPGPWDQPLLWLGGRRVTANTPLCVAGAERGDVLGHLWDTARGQAAEHGMAGVVWPYLDAASARELAEANPSARAVVHSADAVLQVPAGGLDTLAQSVRQHDRKTWRQELREFHGHGATIEWQPLQSGDVAERVAELIARNRTKYGSGGGPELMRRAFAAQLRSGAAMAAIVCFARVGTRIIAAAVFYRYHDWLYGRYWGADEDAPPFTYYILTHYAAVNWAAEHGFRFLHLSVSGWEAKVRRGARLRPLAMVIASSRGAAALVSESIVRKHNNNVVTAWRNRFPSRPEAFHASWSDWE
jgi:predicted N-acyltransferase